MALVMVALFFVFQTVLTAARGQEPRWLAVAQGAAGRHADRFTARLAARTTPTGEPAGWWAQWLHYLPLTLTLVGATALGQALFGTSGWAGAAVTVAAGLVSSLVLVPLAVRISRPRDRD